MEKKEYRKPSLESREIELGVFGDYTGDDGSDGRSGNTTPLPDEIIRKLDIHME